MMNYYSYNIACLITSILMLILVSFKFQEIDLCLILILAAIFSIIWRSIKIVVGQKKIQPLYGEKNYLKNPFFISDFIFEILGYLCVLFSKQINRKFIILTLILFTIGWYFHLFSSGPYVKSISQTIHFCGHCYVIFIVFITFYLYIN